MLRPTLNPNATNTMNKRFHRNLKGMPAKSGGTRRTIEIGPGEFLTGLVRKVALTQKREFIQCVTDDGKVHRFPLAQILSNVAVEEPSSVARASSPQPSSAEDTKRGQDARATVEGLPGGSSAPARPPVDPNEPPPDPGRRNA